MRYNVSKLNADFASKTPQELLSWALSEFHPKIALASSFGAEDVALIDMLVKIKPDTRVFTLDTGRLNEETYEVMDRVRQKYKITVVSYFPDFRAVEKLEKEKGFYSFRASVDNRVECCGIRKVEPLKRALEGLRAWVTGLRHEQSVTRTAVQRFETDEAHGGILKLNPLVDWATEQVWDYIRKNGVPYNRLHDQGYASIGCAPCTRAVKPGEDIRAGRWWWESPDHKECGLHVSGERKPK